MCDDIEPHFSHREVGFCFCIDTDFYKEKSIDGFAFLMYLDTFTTTTNSF